MVRPKSHGPATIDRLSSDYHSSRKKQDYTVLGWSTGVAIRVFASPGRWIREATQASCSKLGDGSLRFNSLGDPYDSEP